MITDVKKIVDILNIRIRQRNEDYNYYLSKFGEKDTLTKRTEGELIAYKFILKRIKNGGNENE